MEMIDFEKMSLAEKNFLKNFFDKERLLGEENLNGWTLDLFLQNLNRIYTNHRDEILNKLCGQKSQNDILNIIFHYFQIMMENVVHDFDEMSLAEKINFLRDIFRRQSLLAEQNLSGWFLIVF